MRTCVIFNPAARGEKAERLRRYLHTLSAECALRPTSGPGQGRPLAACAVREGFETIVAAGGDGTVNEVLNGLGDEPGGLERSRLAVLPIGTVNVFAKEIGMPARLEQAWEVIRRGAERRLDLAEAEFTAAGTSQRRLFVQMAGAGVDAQAIALVDWERKKRFGQVAYWIAGCRALARPKARIVAASPSHTCVGEQILIGNGRYYGGRFRLFPLADLQDGLLEVTGPASGQLAGAASRRVGFDLEQAAWVGRRGPFPGRIGRVEQR